MILTVSNLIISSDTDQLVSGNTYSVTVNLDSDWNGLSCVLRAVYSDTYADYSITNGSAQITIPDGISSIELGVYSGRLTTTNRAKVHVLPSIIRGESSEQIISTCIRIDTDDANQKINSVWISHNGHEFQPVSYARSSGQQGAENISPVWNFVNGYGVFGCYYGAFNISAYESGEDEAPSNTAAGTLAYVLNPNDLKKTLSGYEFTGQYNILFVIPTLYWKAVGNSLYVSDMADYGDITGMVAYAHTGSDAVYDWLGIGVYEGYVDADYRLISVSGVSPTVSKTHDEFRTYALNTGNGFQQWNFYQWTLYKMLAYTVMGTKNSQWMIGNGNVNSESVNDTGLGDEVGTYYADGTVSKMFIENSWGNMWNVIGDTTANALTLRAGQNLGGAEIGTQTAIAGAIMPDSNGFEETLYSESGYWDIPKAVTGTNIANDPYKTGDRYIASNLNGRLFIVGGTYDDAEMAGINQIAIWHASTTANARIGSRLAYLFNNS